MSICFTGHVKSSIFEGGVYIDMSFTTLGRNGSKIVQLDSKKKKDIEDVLNDEFCSLDVDAKAQGTTCSLQNLEFRVQN